MIDYDNFVENCIKNGIKTIPNICSKANEEIQNCQTKIDELSKNIDDLKKNQVKLRLALQQFNVSKVPIIGLKKIKFKELEKPIQKIIYSIIDLISENDHTTHEILNKLNRSMHEEILIAIKWLWENFIIHRNYETKYMTKGKNWQIKESLLVVSI